MTSQGTIIRLECYLCIVFLLCWSNSYSRSFVLTSKEILLDAQNMVQSKRTVLDRSSSSELLLVIRTHESRTSFSLM